MTTLIHVKGLFKFYANNPKIALFAGGRLYNVYVELFPMSAQSILLIKKQYILRINIVFKTLSLYALCFCLYALYVFTFF